jgi:hypothetical protein
VENVEQGLKRTFIPPSHRPVVAGTLLNTGSDYDLKQRFYRAISNDRERRRLLAAILFDEGVDFPLPDWVTGSFKKIFLGKG